jgi:hypothetical protein
MKNDWKKTGIESTPQKRVGFMSEGVNVTHVRRVVKSQPTNDSIEVGNVSCIAPVK